VRFVERRWLSARASAGGERLVLLEKLYYVPHLLLGSVAFWLVPGGRLKLAVVSLLLFCLAIYVVANANHRFRVPLLPLLSLYTGPLLCGYVSRDPGLRRLAGAAATSALFVAIVYAGLTLDHWRPTGERGQAGLLEE
jgi:hypothetical protein